MLSGFDSVGQFFSQPRMHIQDFGLSIVRSNVAPKFEVGSSSKAHGAQRSQMRTQTHNLAMTASEAQANPDTMIGTMIVFGTLAQVFFYSRSSKSFVNTSFTLHVNQELSLLKHKLMVTTPLRE